MRPCVTCVCQKSRQVTEMSETTTHVMQGPMKRNDMDFRLKCNGLLPIWNQNDNKISNPSCLFPLLLFSVSLFLFFSLFSSFIAFIFSCINAIRVSHFILCCCCFYFIYFFFVTFQGLFIFRSIQQQSAKAKLAPTTKW